MAKGKKKGNRAAGELAALGLDPQRLPKAECCVSKTRCRRCPIRMLKEGALPDGLTVKKRKLVTADGKVVTKKKLAKVA